MIRVMQSMLHFQGLIILVNYVYIHFEIYIMVILKRTYTYPSFSTELPLFGIIIEFTDTIYYYNPANRFRGSLIYDRLHLQLFSTYIHISQKYSSYIAITTLNFCQ